MSQRAIRNAGNYGEFQGVMNLFGQTTFRRGITLQQIPTCGVFIIDSDGNETVEREAQTMAALRVENTNKLITHIDGLYDKNYKEAMEFYFVKENSGRNHYGDYNARPPTKPQLLSMNAMLKSPYFDSAYVWGATTYNVYENRHVRVYHNLKQMSGFKQGHTNQIPQSMKRIISIPPLSRDLLVVAFERFNAKSEMLADLTRIAFAPSNILQNENNLLHNETRKLQDEVTLAQFESEIEAYDAQMKAFEEWGATMPEPDSILLKDNYHLKNRMNTIKRDLKYARQGLPTGSSRIADLKGRMKQSAEQAIIYSGHIEAATKLVNEHCAGESMCDICEPSVKAINAPTTGDNE